jgi:hypothetical protein
MSAMIHQFIEIIVAGGTKAASPAVNGTSIFSLATENKTVDNTGEFVAIEDNQQVLVKHMNRVDVRVYDLRLKNANNIYVNTGLTGAKAKVILHAVSGGTEIEIDQVRVSCVEKFDDIVPYVQVTLQKEAIATAFVLTTP